MNKKDDTLYIQAEFFQRLPIALVQVKVGNTLENLRNKITHITEKLYNITTNSVFICLTIFPILTLLFK